MVLAKLIQAAEIEASDRVLDVGCATGYSSAILGAPRALRGRARRGCDAWPASARENLGAVGAANAEVVTGPLPDGWPAERAL